MDRSFSLPGLNDGWLQWFLCLGVESSQYSNPADDEQSEKEKILRIRYRIRESQILRIANGEGGGVGEKTCNAQDCVGQNDENKDALYIHIHLTDTDDADFV